MSSISKVLVSGYSESFFMFDFNTTSGRAGVVTNQDSDKNLTFTVFDKHKGNLYCVHEITDYNEVKNPPNPPESTHTGAVSRWKLNKNGVFERKEVYPSDGTISAHVTLDSSRGLLFITNYGGGSLTVFKLNSDDGAIIKKPLFYEKFEGGSQVDKERQEGPHPHGTHLFKCYAYVVDLGCDKIYHYKISSSEVRRASPNETMMEGGSGPRHLAIDEKRKRAYVLSELVMHVTSYEIDETSGALKKLQNIIYDVPFMNAKTRQYGSEILAHPNGYLYISHRGDGALIVFKISSESQECLTQVQAIPSGGSWPRHFAITEDGKYVLAADQFKNIICVFTIDQATGMLEKVEEIPCDNSPAMIIFL